MLTNHLRRRCLESVNHVSRIWSAANHQHRLTRDGLATPHAALPLLRSDIHVARNDRAAGRTAAGTELTPRENEAPPRSVAPRGVYFAATSSPCSSSFHSHAFTKFAAASAVLEEDTTGSLNHRLPRVSDKMLELTVVDLEGQRASYKARLKEGLTLLGALKDSGVDTGCHCALYDKGLEVCMGNCHVEIADEWLPKFPPRSREELDVLEDHAPGQITRHSRLSCLLPLTKEHDGMVLSVTEEIPWDIP